MRHPLYPGKLGCHGICEPSKLHSVTAAPHVREQPLLRHMGMIGFDIVCEFARSGPRMRGYLVNAPCKQITANKKQSDFALAA